MAFQTSGVFVVMDRGVDVEVTPFRMELSVTLYGVPTARPVSLSVPAKDVSCSTPVDGITVNDAVAPVVTPYEKVASVARRMLELKLLMELAAVVALTCEDVAYT
jgi:hypothetical protein